jgi:hypothetical protein
MLSCEQTIGVEIECHVDRAVIAANNWQIGPHGHGIQIPNWPTGWKVEYDSSVRSHDPHYEGVEIVSPILRGEQGLKDLVAAVDWLREAGTKVGPDCGLHVHCGAAAMTAEAVERLVDLMFTYENAFFGLNGKNCKSRMGNFYSTPINQSWNRHDRYQALNLTNLGHYRKNTVEFRCFYATMRSELVVSIVYLCISLATRAMNGKLPASGVDRSTPLKAMKDYIKSTFAAGRDTADMTYILVEADTQRDILQVMVREARKADASLAPAA